VAQGYFKILENWFWYAIFFICIFLDYIVKYVVAMF
jgi:hypothetical protein